MRTHGANTIHSLGLLVVVALVRVHHTNTGNNQAEMETEGDEFHTLAAAQ